MLNGVHHNNGFGNNKTRMRTADLQFGWIFPYFRKKTFNNQYNHVTMIHKTTKPQQQGQPQHRPKRIVVLNAEGT